MCQTAGLFYLSLQFIVTIISCLMTNCRENLVKTLNFYFLKILKTRISHTLLQFLSHFSTESLFITKVLYNPQVTLQISMWPSRVFRIPRMFGEYQEREFVSDCATWRELRLMSLTMLKMVFLFNTFRGKMIE